MIRACIDCHRFEGQKAPPKVFRRMADELETEARGVFVRHAARELLGDAAGKQEFNRLRRRLTRTSSMRQKLQVEHKALRTHGIEYKPWPGELRCKIGARLARAVSRGLFRWH
jgi:hypothetical protein